MKTIILTFLGLSVTCVCSGQFIPYSQYQHAPVLTNPAHVAMGNYTEVLFQHRQSRISNYEIPAVSFVSPLFNMRNGKRYGGVGATVVSQSSGPGNIFKTTGAIGGFAYTIHFSKTHHISAGIQGGIINKKIDLSGIVTESQISVGMYDPALPTGENISNAGVTRLVVNSGFSWYLTDQNQNQKASLGVAFYSMNKPSYEMLAGAAREDVTYVISGEMKAWERNGISLQPSFRYIRSYTSLANIGGVVEYQLNTGKEEINLGMWYKTNKAMVFSLGYTHSAYIIAGAYEFSIASLDANLNNAFEIVLGWRVDKSKNKSKRKVFNPMR
jgi:type IX secretion system PorP/SprF family membrane protein